MRAAVLLRIFSRLSMFSAISLAVPLIFALINLESKWYAWLFPLLFAGGLSWFSWTKSQNSKDKEGGLRRREGLLAVSLGWLVLVSFTASAYYLSGSFDSLAACFFESMSGYTTTGATVVKDIESLPGSILLMRSLSHWIGGMGIIVLSVAVLPELSVAGMQLVEAETSGLESEKLAPRIADTARRLWGFYVGITVAQTGFLIAGGMTIFDSINHAMATIATGGFSTKNASIAGFDSLYVESVILVFMFLSGINFVILYRALLGRDPKRLWSSPELRLYVYLTLGACAVVSLVLLFSGHYGFVDAFRFGSFQVVSILTTTGFGTADFDAWPQFTRLFLVALMLIGGCAGSTAGGSKVVRLYVVAKHAGIQLNRLVRPRIVQTLQMGQRSVSRETIEAVLGFYLLYFLAIMVASLVMAGLGMDLVSASTAAISAMNSIGPGLGSVGAAQNFGQIPAIGLYVLSFCMLLGRLEIYTLLVLFVPRFWKNKGHAI
jgi:trk system potassium uptake protein TrkH